MSFVQDLISKLWRGPYRRPFEAIVRRTIATQSRVYSGPLKGSYFAGGGLAQILGVYEIHVQNAINDNLGMGDVFYDIGANNGYISLFGTQCVGKKGYVYGFEPFPQNVSRIQDVMAHNKISNYKLIPKAVSNVLGSAELYFENHTSMATPSLIKGQGAGNVLISTITLDDFVTKENHLWPDLIKIDVEGAESLVLQGAKRVVSGQPAPIWIIEVHSKENYRFVKQIFEAENYQIQDVAAQVNSKSYPCHILAGK